jgi:hypothetical protein
VSDEIRVAVGMVGKVTSLEQLADVLRRGSDNDLKAGIEVH